MEQYLVHENALKYARPFEPRSRSVFVERLYYLWDAMHQKYANGYSAVYIIFNVYHYSQFCLLVCGKEN